MMATIARGINGRPRSLARESTIFDLRAQGLSVLQISRKTGINRTSIYYVLKNQCPAELAKTLEAQEIESRYTSERESLDKEAKAVGNRIRELIRKRLDLLCSYGQERLKLIAAQLIAAAGRLESIKRVRVKKPCNFNNPGNDGPGRAKHGIPSRALSLDYEFENGESFQGLVADANAPAPEEQLEFDELRKLLSIGIGGLSELQEQIIKARFWYSKLDDDLAADLGLSVESIEAEFKAAIKMLGDLPELRGLLC